MKTLCELVARDGKKALKFASTTHVNVNLLIYSFRMDGREEALVADEGTIRYSRTTREKDKMCEVKGRLDHGRFVLDIRENGVPRTMAVERSEYDFTTMECPEIAMKHEGDEMTLRLLDLETLSVVTRRYRWIKSEEIAVDGRRILCRVIDFADANKKCRRWISPDSMGAIIVRQDGTGKNGRYSLRMVHLKDGT